MNPSVTANLTALTIQHGNGASSACDCGGGIDNNGGALTVTSSTVTANSTGYIGAGIFSTGTLVVANSMISGNGTLQGGGLVNGGTAIPAASIVSVTGTQIVYLAPAHAAGPVTVAVSVTGVAAAASMGYTYVTVAPLPQPQSPGPAGGPRAPLPAVRPPGTTAGSVPNSLPAPRP